MFECYISNENRRLLKLFNQYDEIVNWVCKEIKYANECCGLVGTTICRKDFDAITEEMENYFKGREEFYIEIDWNLNCELVEIDWDAKYCESL